MELKRCACGATPTRLAIEGTENYRYARATCDECGEWSIEFCTEWQELTSERCSELAREAWNDAPRADELNAG